MQPFLARRRSVIRWAVLSLLLCGAATARAGEELAFAVARLPLSLPIYVAQAQGYFADEKLALRIVDCDFGRRCLDRLIAGQVQLATSADSPIVFASLKGSRVSVLATIATTRNDAKIVVRRGGGIAQVADLQGRRVGTFIGTTAQYFLELSLLSAGVDPDKVHVVPIVPAEAATALVTGRVDAVSVFEPFAFQVARALGSQALVMANKRVYTESWNVVASTALGAHHDADLQALCRALVRATAYIAREPGAARAILRERLGLDDAAVAWVWPDYDYEVELRQSLITGLEAQARWALRSGHASGAAPNYLEYIRSGPLAHVRPGAVSIVQ